MSKITKAVVGLLAGVATIVSLTGCSAGSDGSSEDPIVVRLGHALTEDSSWHVGAEYFAEQVAEQTDGRYEVQIFANGQLASGNQRKAIEMLRQGSYDVDMTSALIWSGFDEELGITALPWILPTYEDVESVVQGEGGEMLLDTLDENGVTAVAVGETGYRQMLNNEQQIESPSDLNNLKIRVPGTPMFLDLFSELGADPIEMDFSEVFTALEQGTIDGMEGVPDVMVSSRFYEAINYVSLNNYNFDFFFTTFSNDFYDGLSSEDQEIFMQAGKDATQQASEHARGANEEAVEFLKDEVDVFEPDEQQLADFQEAAAPIYDAYRDTFSEELRTAFSYPE